MNQNYKDVRLRMAIGVSYHCITKGCSHSWYLNCPNYINKFKSKKERNNWIDLNKRKPGHCYCGRAFPKFEWIKNRWEVISYE